MSSSSSSSLLLLLISLRSSSLVLADASSEVHCWGKYGYDCPFDPINDVRTCTVTGQPFHTICSCTVSVLDRHDEVSAPCTRFFNAFVVGAYNLTNPVAIPGASVLVVQGPNGKQYTDLRLSQLSIAADGFRYIIMDSNSDAVWSSVTATVTTQSLCVDSNLDQLPFTFSCGDGKLNLNKIDAPNGIDDTGGGPPPIPSPPGGGGSGGSGGSGGTGNGGGSGGSGGTGNGGGSGGSGGTGNGGGSGGGNGQPSDSPASNPDQPSPTDLNGSTLAATQTDGGNKQPTSSLTKSINHFSLSLVHGNFPGPTVVPSLAPGGIVTFTSNKTSSSGSMSVNPAAGGILTVVCGALLLIAYLL